METDTKTLVMSVMSSQEIVLSNPLLLETIFRHLAPADIKAVSLVSRSADLVQRGKNYNFQIEDVGSLWST